TGRTPLRRPARCCEHWPVDPSRRASMTTVTPRWEWRTFGRAGPVADRVFYAPDASPVAESDETYFLTGSGANVKIRDELVDIKLLRETDENRLERCEAVQNRTVH